MKDAYDFSGVGQDRFYQPIGEFDRPIYVLFEHFPVLMK